MIRRRSKKASAPRRASQRSGLRDGLPQLDEHPAPTLRRPTCAGADRRVISDSDWHRLALHLGLSGRERQIVQCIFDDSKEAAISLELGISQHTVHTYILRLYRKLGVASRCQLAVRVFAEHTSLIAPPVAKRPADQTRSRRR